MATRSNRSRLLMPLLLGALPLLVFGCGGDDPTSPNDDDDDPVPTPTFTVTVSVTGDGEGTVTSSPAGISCTQDGGTCAGTYDQGTSVTLTATPGTGFELAGWSGACSGTGACSFTVTAATEVGVDFDDPTVETMTVGSSGGALSSPDGSVALTIPGGSLSTDTEITIRETDIADVNAAFAVLGGTPDKAWELGPSGTTFAQPITIEWRTEDTSVADTTINVPVLATLSDGAVEILGGGSVRRDGGDIVVTGQLDHFSPLIAYRELIEVWAFAPASAVVGVPFDAGFRAVDGSKFSEPGPLEGVQWQDATTTPLSKQGPANENLVMFEDVDGTNLWQWDTPYVCEAVGTGVIMGSAQLTTRHAGPFGDIAVDDVRATVECTAAPTKRLTITKSGTGTGGVTSAPAGIDCGSNCAFDFTENAVVTLTAVPDAGSTFCGWTSSSTESAATVTVTMAVDATVDACFNAIPVPTEVEIDAGSVSSSGGVVSSGTQTVNLTDGGNTVGTMPVTFTSPTFVGSNPARFGFGQNGAILLDFLNATLPGGFPAFAELTLRICGINNSAQADLRVERQDGSGNIVAFETLAVLNTCVLIAASQLVNVIMVTNAFFDITMQILRPSSGQTEVQAGPPPELVIS